jgi:hypothetical protein
MLTKREFLKLSALFATSVPFASLNRLPVVFAEEHSTEKEYQIKAQYIAACAFDPLGSFPRIKRDMIIYLSPVLKA